MSFLEYSGVAFWVLALLAFVGYVIARICNGLDEFDSQPSIDELIRRADEARDKARKVSSRSHVRAGVYQSKGSES